MMTRARDLLTTVLLLAACVSAAENVNRHGFAVRGGSLEMIGGTEYFVSDEAEQVTQAEAEMRCSDMGMQLLSIETAAENSILVDYCSTRDCYFRFIWTSGVKISNRRWDWGASSGVQIEYFSWALTQPDNNDQETAITLYPQMGWWDIVPTEPLSNYMCEHPPIVPAN